MRHTRRRTLRQPSRTTTGGGRGRDAGLVGSSTAVQQCSNTAGQQRGPARQRSVAAEQRSGHMRAMPRHASRSATRARPPTARHCRPILYCHVLPACTAGPLSCTTRTSPSSATAPRCTLRWATTRPASTTATRVSGGQQVLIYSPIESAANLGAGQMGAVALNRKILCCRPQLWSGGAATTS